MPENSPPPRDTQLALLIQQPRGNLLPSFEQMVSSYSPLIKRQIHKRFHSRFQAKFDETDVFQEVLTKAWVHFNQFQGCSADELVGWLIALVKNTTCDLEKFYLQTGKRNIRREVSLEDRRVAAVACRIPGTGLEPERGLSQQEETASYGGLVRDLPERCSQVVRLRTEGNLTFEIIGSQIGCSGEAARKAWKRGVKIIRMNLKNRNTDRGGE